MISGFFVPERESYVRVEEDAVYSITDHCSTTRANERYQISDGILFKKKVFRLVSAVSGNRSGWNQLFEFGGSVEGQ